MNEQLTRLSRAQRPVWVEGSGALGAALSVALDGSFVDAREADERMLVDSLGALRAGGRPIVIGLGDAPRAGVMAVVFALLHDQLHGPEGTQDWSGGPPVWIVAPRAGLADAVASRLRLHARAESLGLPNTTAPRAEARPSRPPAKRGPAGLAPRAPTQPTNPSRAPRAAAGATLPRPRGR
jgi:hypothetical protein